MTNEDPSKKYIEFMQTTHANKDLTCWNCCWTYDVFTCHYKYSEALRRKDMCCPECGKKGLYKIEPKDGDPK